MHNIFWAVPKASRRLRGKKNPHISSDILYTANGRIVRDYVTIHCPLANLHRFRFIVFLNTHSFHIIGLIYFYINFATLCHLFRSLTYKWTHYKVLIFYRTMAKDIRAHFCRERGQCLCYFDITINFTVSKFCEPKKAL